MPDDPDPTFGQLLRAARRAAGISSTEKLAQLLTERGFDTTGSNVSAWERDQWAPKTADPVLLLEEILEVTDSRLMASLGLRPPGPDFTEILDGLTAEVRQLQQMLRKHLHDHDDGRGDAH